MSETKEQCTCNDEFQTVHTVCPIHPPVESRKYHDDGFAGGNGVVVTDKDIVSTTQQHVMFGFKFYCPSCGIDAILDSFKYCAYCGTSVVLQSHVVTNHVKAQRAQQGG